MYPVYQIKLGTLADVVDYNTSCGMEYDRELGYLIAEEELKQFRYCWGHQTSVYKEET